MDPRKIKNLRQQLGLTQQSFASLLGLSFVSINKWENEGSSPTGLSVVLLDLLDSVLRTQPADAVLRELRSVGGAPVDIVRKLTQLERHHG